MPKLSRLCAATALALFAALLLAAPAAADEAPAVAEPVAVEAPTCEAAPEPPPFLETEVEAPRATGCTTCPAEPHACTDNSDCDAYCSGCSGNCILSKYSVCPWIEITFPRVCQCA